MEGGHGITSASVYTFFESPYTYYINRSHLEVFNFFYFRSPRPQMFPLQTLIITGKVFLIFFRFQMMNFLYGTLSPLLIHYNSRDHVENILVDSTILPKYFQQKKLEWKSCLGYRIGWGRVLGFFRIRDHRRVA